MAVGKAVVVIFTDGVAVGVAVAGCCSLKHPTLATIAMVISDTIAINGFLFVGTLTPPCLYVRTSRHEQVYLIPQSINRFSYGLYQCGDVMTASTTASRKAKGRAFQQELRDDLINALHVKPEDIKSTPMGTFGPDLWLSSEVSRLFPFAVEAKRSERIDVGGWLNQCENNANKAGLKPLLVFRKNRGKAMAVIEWDTLLMLISKAQK